MTKQDKSLAGSRLLLHAMKRNVDRVEQRYRDKRTRELCQQVAHLCDEGLRMLSEGKLFGIFMSWQPTLPDYETDDTEYGLDDPMLNDDGFSQTLED